mgnify:CR=1 FL=1
MAKGAPKPVTNDPVSQLFLAHSQLRSLTHERPVSEEEEAGQRVEGDVGARALLVVVRATELGAGGREATAGDE